MSDDNTSTDTTSSTELKAGHAPATKVGGMRVSAPRPRHTSQGEDKNDQGDQESSGDNAANESENQEADEEANNDEQAGTVANRAAGQLVGGTFVPIQKAFPTEAVKNIHDKPGTHPKHEVNAYNKHDHQKFLNQPRKQ